MSEDFAGDELLEVAEIARYLRVNNVTVYRWCREGRLPCLKLGKAWRVRRSALDNFLAQREHSTTLMAQLRSFYRVPDNVLAVAQTPEMLYRLDAAFLQVGETRGGRLTKFYSPGSGETRDQLRAELEAVDLDIERLEDTGRLHLIPEENYSREELLLRSHEAAAAEGRTLWALFNWAVDVDLEQAFEWQEQLSKIVVELRQVVVQTTILEKDMDEWLAPLARRSQVIHTGTAWLAKAGLSTTRATPVTWG